MVFSLFYDKEVLPSGYSVFCSDHPSRGGGVLLAVVPATLIFSGYKTSNHSSIIPCVVYIPPQSSHLSYSSLLLYRR